MWVLFKGEETEMEKNTDEPYDSAAEATKVMEKEVAKGVLEDHSPVNNKLPSKSPPQVENPLVIVAALEQSPAGSIDRDAVLARLAQEKKLALIKAWEESEKTKADNKAYKKMSAIDAWENSKRASIEAQLKKIEEKLEKQKAQYAEKMMNKIVEIHKQAEEKKAITEAERGEDLLKIEEEVAKYHATGSIPRRGIQCFGC